MKGRDVSKWLRRIGVYVLTAVLVTQPIAGAQVVSGVTVSENQIESLVDEMVSPEDGADIFESDEISAESVANADGFDIQDGVLVSYTGTAEEVNIPEGVTSIASNAFRGLSTVKKITMPDSMVSIKDSAIISCANLTEVVFGKNMKDLEETSVIFCNSLNKVTFPVFTSEDDLSKVSPRFVVVDNKDNLGYEIVIPKESTYIPVDAFGYKCNKVTMEAPNDRLSVEGSCVYTTEVDSTGKKVKTLIASAGYFEGDLTVSSDTDVIAKHAFHQTKVDGTLSIPENVTLIKNGAMGPAVINKLKVDAKNLTMERHAFLEDNELGSVTGKCILVLTENNAFYSSQLQQEVTNAFQHGYALEIPADITSFDSGWMTDSYVDGFIVDAGNEKYETIGGVLYEKTGNMINGVPERKLVKIPSIFNPSNKTFEVPSGVVSIEKSAGSSMDFVRTAFGYVEGNKVEKVVLSDDVKRIEDYGLFREYHLSEVVLNDAIEYIGYEAFAYTTNDIKVVFPEQLSENFSMSSGALRNVKTIDIPKAYTPADLQKFINPNIASDLVMLNIAEDSPYFMVKDGTILSKDGSILYYVLPTEEASFTVPDGVTEIANFAFSNPSNAGLEVTLADSVEKIDTNAFYRKNADLVLHAGDVRPQIAEKALSGVSFIKLDERAGSVYEYALKYKVPYSSEKGNITFKIQGEKLDGTKQELNYKDFTFMVEYLDATPVGAKIEDGVILLPVSDQLQADTRILIGVMDPKEGYKIGTSVVILDENCNADAGVISMEEQLYLTVQPNDIAKAYLYDNNGKFICKLDETNNGLECKVEPGAYQVLLHQGPEATFKQDQLSKLDALELEKDIDYALVPVVVTREQVVLSDIDVPVYVEKTNLFNPKKSEYTATYNIVRECYDMDLKLVRSVVKNKALDERGFYEIAISIPDGYIYLDGSAKNSAGEEGSFYYDEEVNMLYYTSWTDPKEQRIQFTVLPTEEGKFPDGISVVNRTDMGFVEESVISVKLEEGGVTIQAPQVINSVSIPVSGFGNADCEVEVYTQFPGDDQPYLAEVVETNKAGYFSTEVYAVNLGVGETVSIYAVLKDEKKDKTLTSETKYVQRKEMIPTITDFDIDNWGHHFEVNPINGRGPVLSYYPYVPTTFTIRTDLDEYTERMILKDSSHEFELFYDEEKKAWVGQSLKQYFNDEMAVYAEVHTASGETELVKIKDINIKWIIDPSGYVYEAFPDQRIEGAMVAVYDCREYSQGEEWDAEPYLQINPIETGEDGTFAWDVPKGNWRLRASKKGYFDYKTSIFEIPPVRTDLYIELTPKARKVQVTGVELSDHQMKVTFDTYMQTSTVVAEGTVSLYANDTLISSSKASALNEREYERKKVAKEFIFEYEENLADLQPEDGFTFMCQGRPLRGYCDPVGYCRDYFICEDTTVTDLEVTGIVGSIVTDSAYAIQKGYHYLYEIQVSPADVVKGRQVTASVKDDSIAEVMKVTTIGKDGKALLVLSGKELGQTTVTLGVAGSAISTKVEVQVVMDGTLLEQLCEINAVEKPATISQQQIDEIQNPDVSDLPDEDKDDKDKDDKDKDDKDKDDDSKEESKEDGKQDDKPDQKPSVSANDIEKPSVSANSVDIKPIETGVTKPVKKAPVKGKTYTVKSMKYKVTNAKTDGKGTVAIAGASKKTVTSITIPKTVKIDGYTYKVTQIADKAFKGYKKLKKVTIGENVTKIGKNAFEGCGKLKNISVKTTKLTSVGKKALKGVNAKCVIKVPKKKLAKYQKLFKGKGQGKKVKIKK